MIEQARSGSPQCDLRHAARLPYDERGNIARDASCDRRVQRAARRLLQEHVREVSGPADEVAELAQLVLGRQGAFIIGFDFLVDGGATASYFYGPLRPEK